MHIVNGHRGTSMRVPRKGDECDPVGHGSHGGAGATSSLVLGIIAVVLCWIPFLNIISLILALIALPLASWGLVRAKKHEGDGKSSAVTGLVLSFVALGVSVAVNSAVFDGIEEVDESLTGKEISNTVSPGASEGGSKKSVHAYGETVTFKDGSTLKCLKPVSFKPDEFAMGGKEFPIHVKSRCTFVNKTTEVFNPALTNANMSSDGVEGESVYQSGLDAPENPVLPGKSVTWWMGYGVQKTDDVTMTVRLGFLDYEDVIFDSGA
jgi:hypothetical protein